MLETGIVKTFIGATLAALSGIAADATAQEYPNRPITMVVAYAAGGPVDTVGRIFGSRLSEVLGQQVIIENIGGAGGMTGAGRVAKASPDGYYALFGGSSNLAQNQTLYRKPLYNSATDFEPVSLLTDSPRALITRKDFPATTLPEFAAYAKANQDKLQYYSAGGGSGSHICALLLDQAMDTHITHVPYRGAGPAMQDLIAGRIDYACEQISTAFPQIEAGTVKAIAILGLDRVPGLPNVPSAPEAGLRDLDCSAWSALVLPKGTPEPIVRRLAQAANEALDTPSLRERLESVGVTIIPKERRGPDYLAKFIPSEIKKWEGPIKASGVVMD
jgi:tripartite-type tricarboxylate transporter receptor subunit TctC